MAGIRSFMGVGGAYPYGRPWCADAEKHSCELEMQNRPATVKHLGRHRRQGDLNYAGEAEIFMPSHDVGFTGKPRAEDRRQAAVARTQAQGNGFLGPLLA